MQVFRYDSPSPLILCHVTGDPRVAGFGSPMVQSTFGRYHTISGAGNFIYAQSKDGLPFEVTFAIVLVLGCVRKSQAWLSLLPSAALLLPVTSSRR